MNEIRLVLLLIGLPSPDDERYALIDSRAWTWSKESAAPIAGHQRVSADRAGKRLLGIRIDKDQVVAGEEGKRIITVTLLNAGGATNGPAIGACAIRYAVKAGEGVTVALAEPSD